VVRILQGRVLGGHNAAPLAAWSPSGRGNLNRYGGRLSGAEGTCSLLQASRRVAELAASPGRASGDLRQIRRLLGEPIWPAHDRVLLG